MPWGSVQARIKEPCDKDWRLIGPDTSENPSWSLADHETNLAKTLVAIHSKECPLHRISTEKWERKNQQQIQTAITLNPWEKGNWY